MLQIAASLERISSSFGRFLSKLSVGEEAYANQFCPIQSLHPRQAMEPPEWWLQYDYAAIAGAPLKNRAWRSLRSVHVFSISLWHGYLDP